MTIFLLLTLLAGASAALTKPSPRAGEHTPRNNDTGSEGIQWGECEFNATVPIECSSLQVPLDYTDPEAGTLDLALSKVAAVNEPFKGSILFNFGGPGYEAIEQLGGLAPLLHNITGGQHDLIAFDPRGTGKTIPFDCFETPEERELANYRYGLERIMSDSTDVAPGDLWANTGAFGNVCKEARKDIGELIGTAFVARDMMQIVDALNEDGLLRFWGMSYGSALGANAAAMFPERIDRVVLDAVVNTQQYNHGYGIDSDQMGGADAAWTALLEECIAVGELCGISQLNETAEELEETLNRVAEQYRTNPVAVGETVLTYAEVRTLYYILVKTPSDLTTGTTMVNNLVTGENLTAVAEYFEALSEGVATGNEALFGIKCSDTTARSSDMEGVMEEAEYAQKSSKNFGALQQTQAMMCAQWPFEAKERYEGDFGVETRNPILFVGNTHDAATDIDSTYGMSELFPGSLVLEQKGFGHGLISQRSECTWKTLRDYFVDGVTPDGNIKCEVDVPLFIEAKPAE